MGQTPQLIVVISSDYPMIIHFFDNLTPDYQLKTDDSQLLTLIRKPEGLSYGGWIYSLPTRDS